jgi:phosphonate metabolism-associated iron-containing alcohol dehydrogenase
MTENRAFHNPVRLKFGVGLALPEVAALPYRRMLLVTSAGMNRRGTAQRFVGAARGAIAQVEDRVAPNPSMAALDDLARRHRASGFDAIVALGGGSVIDTAKVLGVLLGAPAGFTLHGHFLEKQAVPDAPRVPVIAFPTTAGTGSEVTPFATVWHDGPVKKYSLAHERMFPELAVLDPELTRDLPWDVTLSTGLDALCQALESIWNRHANPVTLGFAMRAVQLAWPALQQGRKLLDSPAARAALLEASLLAGLAISHTRTALCHSMSYPVTARFGLPHGLACAFSMPAVLRYNTVADDGRLAELARELNQPQPQALADALARQLSQLGVPRYFQQAVGDFRNLQPLIPEMITPGRSDNNLRPVQLTDVAAILQDAELDQAR